MKAWVCIGLLWASAAVGQSVYSWTDAAGEVHYTDDLGRVPAKHRKKLRHTRGDDISVVQGVRYPERAREVEAPSARRPNLSRVKLLVFSATWCGPCRKLEQSGKLEALKLRVPDVGIEHVDIDTQKERANRYAVHGVPTLMVVDDSGQEVGRLNAWAPVEQLAEAVARLAPARGGE